MARKFSFKGDERKIKKDGIAGYDQEGNEIIEQDSFAETEEEHATRIAEAEERRGRGEYTDDEKKEIEEAAKAQEEREKYLEGSRDARAKLGLLTADEKKEDKAKQIAADRQARKERYEAGMAKVDEMIAQRKENEEARREAWHQSNVDARNRRLDARDQIAIRDPGRYSPQTRQAALEWMEQKESNRRFDVENETRLQESADKREGMINQGKAAHEADANAAMTVGKSRYGYFGDDGVYHPGSEVLSEEKKAAAIAALQDMKGKTAESVAQIKADSQESIAAGKNETALTKQDMRGKSNENVAQINADANRAAAEKRAQEAEKKRQQDAEMKTEQGWQKAFTMYASDIEKGLNQTISARAWKTMTPEEKQSIFEKNSGYTKPTAKSPAGTDAETNDVSTTADGKKWKIIRDANGKPIGRQPIQ